MLTFLLNMVAFYLTAWLLPGVRVKGSWIYVAFMLLLISILNWGLRPFLLLLSIPLVFLTFGLFVLIINGVIFLIASLLVEKVEIDDLPTAVLTWGVYSLISFTINYPFYNL
jgi:putative membrane protein